MPNYTVARINHTPESAQYHLLDHRDKVLLVADYGSPWVPSHQLRLARPDGKPIAALTLPRPTFSRLRRQTPTLASYALVIENSVYAVINKLQPAAANQSDVPYFIIEVESQKWLALDEPEQKGRFALYSGVPPRLAFTPLRQLPLPATIGLITPLEPPQDEAETAYAFTITLEPGRLRHVNLILLALLFLLDWP
ncbi:MAG: hypothetical protein KJ063_01210 [Anaerolineae bacterium]|nr:hypothetical protein [Anaerolineae bacterium]